EDLGQWIAVAPRLPDRPHVPAGAEGALAGTANDDHANGVIRLPGGELRADGPDHRQRQRIQRLRPVQGDESGAAADLDENVLRLAHVFSLAVKEIPDAMDMLLSLRACPYSIHALLSSPPIVIPAKRPQGARAGNHGWARRGRLHRPRIALARARLSGVTV